LKVIRRSIGILPFLLYKVGQTENRPAKSKRKRRGRRGDQDETKLSQRNKQRTPHTKQTANAINKSKCTTDKQQAAVVANRTKLKSEIEIGFFQS
jgi:hypothetical protein